MEVCKGWSVEQKRGVEGTQRIKICGGVDGEDER